MEEEAGGKGGGLGGRRVAAGICSRGADSLRALQHAHFSTHSYLLAAGKEMLAVEVAQVAKQK